MSESSGNAIPESNAHGRRKDAHCARQNTDHGNRPSVTEPLSGFFENHTAASATSAMKPPSLEKMLRVIREFSEKHDRKDHIDVFVMTDEILEELKACTPEVHRNPEDRMGGPWTCAGVRIESFPTHAECLVRAFELKVKGKNVGLVIQKEDDDSAANGSVSQV